MYPAPKRACQAILLLIALVGPLSAAPVDEPASDASAATAVDSADSKSAERVATPHVSSGSRTVDMLVELQGQRAALALAASERAAARGDALGAMGAPKAGLVANTPAAAVPSPNRAGLFGTSAAPPAPSRDAPPTASSKANWQAVHTDSSAAGPTAGPAPRAYEPSASHDDGRLSLPRVVVAWIRENRTLVIGVAVMVLVAVGASSIRMAQRRR